MIIKLKLNKQIEKIWLINKKLKMIKIHIFLIKINNILKI